MEEKAILDMWKSYDRKLEQSLKLNQENAEAITRLKVHSLLKSMSSLKIFTVVTGVLWVIFVDLMVVGSFGVASPFFTISIGLQSLLTKLAIGIYLYQLILVHETDISEPILATQEKLASLKTTTLWIARFLFLQLPLWTTFYLSVPTLQNAGTGYLIVQTLVTLGFAVLSIWLFINIKPENKDKKWFRLLFEGREWTPVMQSMALLDQVKEYRKQP